MRVGSPGVPSTGGAVVFSADRVARQPTNGQLMSDVRIDPREIKARRWALTPDDIDVGRLLFAYQTDPDGDEFTEALRDATGNVDTAEYTARELLALAAKLLARGH